MSPVLVLMAFNAVCIVLFQSSIQLDMQEIADKKKIIIAKTKTQKSKNFIKVEPKNTKIFHNFLNASFTDKTGRFIPHDNYYDRKFFPNQNLFFTILRMKLMFKMYMKSLLYF